MTVSAMTRLTAAVTLTTVTPPLSPSVPWSVSASPTHPSTNKNTPSQMNMQCCVIVLLMHYSVAETCCPCNAPSPVAVCATSLTTYPFSSEHFPDNAVTDQALLLQYMASYQVISAVSSTICFCVNGSSFTRWQVTPQAPCFDSIDAVFTAVTAALAAAADAAGTMC